MHARIIRLRKARLDFASCLVIGTFAVIITFIAGKRGVELNDMSIMVDGGWRVSQGQMPYRDFLMPVGPIVFYIQAAFFRLLGLSWDSLLVHVATISVIVVVSTYLICRRWHGRSVSGLLALLGAATFYLPMAFPWHDNTAFLFILLGFVVLERQSNKRRISQLGTGLVLGALLGLSILSKHNIGIAAFGLVLFVLLFDAWLSRRKGLIIRVWGYLLGGLLSVGGASAYFSFVSGGTFLKSIATSSAAVSRVLFFLSVRRHIADLLLPDRLILNTSTWLFFLAVLLSLWILVTNRLLFRKQGALARSCGFIKPSSCVCAKDRRWSLDNAPGITRYINGLCFILGSADDLLAERCVATWTFTDTWILWGLGEPVDFFGAVGYVRRIQVVSR